MSKSYVSGLLVGGPTGGSQSGSAKSLERIGFVFISINGIIQTPTSAYTISGSTVTFASNLSDGDVVVARYQR